MYANVVNNYTKSKFSVIFPICLFKYISPKIIKSKIYLRRLS